MSEPKTEIFEHSGQKIPYRIVFDRHKTVRLRLDSAGCAVVKMPFSLPKDYAQKMLLKHFQWIVQKREETENISAKPETEEVFIFGKAFPVLVNPPSRSLTEKLRFFGYPAYFSAENLFQKAAPCLQTAHRSVHVTDSRILVSCANRQDPAKILLSWRKKSAELFLPYYYRELWNVFSEKTQNSCLCKGRKNNFLLSPPLLHIRNCKRCFGSCRVSAREGTSRIMLSQHLMGLPLEYAEFVILHEFCHLIHTDHSPHFYGLFDAVLPKNKIMRAGIQAWAKTHNSF